MAPALLFKISGLLLYLLVIAPVTAVVAWRKGFNPYIWLFGGGFIGLITLAFIPRANRSFQNFEEKKSLRERSTRTALTIIGIYFGVIILLYLTGLLYSLEYVERIYPVK